MTFSRSVVLLIEPEAHTGAWNMAFDEALLEAALQTGLTAVRFYRWSEPTLSLGYFQKRLPDPFPAELLPLSRVRRLSGGGAILHDQEWTYSCAIPPLHPIAVEPVQLYEIVHREFVALFNEQGIPADLRGTDFIEYAEEPFLCFGRQDPRDIVLGPHKIVGSAQRRRRGAVLQHGSLLLNRSPLAPLYPGLCDLAGDDLSIEEWIPLLARRIARRLGDGLTESGESTRLPEIVEQANRLEREKYRNVNWR